MVVEKIVDTDLRGDGLAAPAPWHGLKRRGKGAHVLLPHEQGDVMLRAQEIHRIPQRDQDLGLRIECLDLRHRAGGKQIEGRGLAQTERLFLAGRVLQVLLQGRSDGAPYAQVAAEIAGLLLARHQDLRMRTEMVPKRRGTAAGGADDKEVGVTRRGHAWFDHSSKSSTGSPAGTGGFPVGLARRGLDSPCARGRR